MARRIPSNNQNPWYTDISDYLLAEHSADGSHIRPTTTVTGAYTILSTDRTIRCNLSANASITLPAPGSIPVGMEFRIKKVDATASVVTVVGTVDGVTNPTLVAQNDSLLITNNGTTYDSW